ncbi:MAG: SOS response-associated peptidase [Bacteroidia bacterium]|nr:SOS response-associated peptidase [Bacteroidia bacterium]
MCFTVNVNLIREELENRYNADLIDHDKYRPSYYYHAYALPELPALCSGYPGKIRLLKWGLIPYWTRGIDEANEIRLKTFNAKSESLDTKPSFSAGFKSKRCIIPVKGFFEWQHAGKEKLPWYIYRADNEIMSLAGIYDEWTESNTGEQFTTFSIITTDANLLMSEIHNSKKRMPVLLEKESELLWLNTALDLVDAKRLLRPASEEILKAHTISPLINNRNSDRNTPEVIKPYNYNQQQLLF